MPRIYTQEDKAIRDDVSLVKVKVTPRRNKSRSRSRSRSRARATSTERRQSYVINGKSKSVVLEFTQQKTKSNKFGGGLKTTGNRGAAVRGERGRERGRTGAREGAGAGGAYTHRNTKLGNRLGKKEFKKRVLQKAQKEEAAKKEKKQNGQGLGDEDGNNDVDDELANDIDELRQIFNDQDVGSEDGEYTGEDANADADAGWFNLDQNAGKDFYNEFLKSVKCSAYTTECVSPQYGSCVRDELKCGDFSDDMNTRKCVDDLNCSGNEVVEEREEGVLAREEIADENYQLLERDLEDELREMEDYRNQLNQMEQVEEQEMTRVQREDEEAERDQRQSQLQSVKEVQNNRGQHNQANIKNLNQLSANDEDENDEEKVLTVQSDDRTDEGEKNSSNKAAEGNWFENVFARLLDGDFSALEEIKAEASKKLYENVKCGENLDVLDLFDCADESKFVPLGVEEEKRIFYRAVSNHVDSPPTALYAAIGTKSWNIALRRLLENPKEASVWVKNASTDGETVFRFLPLHIACLSGAPLLLVTLLVQAYPNAVKYNAMGKLPIHMACETLADHRIVFLLLNTWPESINVKDEEESTPIEIASLHDPCDERKSIVKVLTQKLECTVVKSPTALYSFIDSQDWNSAIMRLVEMPQEATTWVSFKKKRMEVRFLPLHIACLLGAPYFLISDLAHAYPDAVRKKTTQGQLPLHIACEAHGDERVVELLLEFWPESLFVKDDAGNTALEVASGTEYSPEKTCILALLQKKLDHKDKIVYAPTKLYANIESRNWDVAVRRCLEAPDEVSTWIGSCQKMKDAKLLPIHLACSLKAPLILIAVIIQTFPESIKRTNNSGKLPIHLACEKRADHRIISLLLHTWPDSYHELDEKGNTPVQVALISSPSPERTKIVETLMAFEAKSEKETLVVTNPMFDVENEAKELVQQHQPKRGDENNKEGNENERQKSSKRGTSRKPKKRRNKQLWKDDAEMFANA